MDTFLDLCAKHGDKIRWYTVVGNDRLKPLQYILNHSSALIGFSDAGAHLRNMAYYNIPLRMLKRVRDAQVAGKPFMSIEKAVWKLTGEIGEWFHIDAGVLEIGSRADIVILDPKYLNESVEEVSEDVIPELGNLKRLVRRNNDLVKKVFINGKLGVENGIPLEELGKQKGFGQFLKTKA